MKSKIIVMSKGKYIILFSFTLIFVSVGTVLFDNNYVIKQYNIVQNSYQNSTSQLTNNNYEIEQNSCQNSPSPLTQTTSSHINKLEIKEIEGTEVIGKLEIPKIELVTYILADTCEETLDKSVTKLYGPKANDVGNLCITGHNYHNDRMFGNLKKIELNDKIYVTGTNGNRIEYVVYDIYKVYPNEVECLSQETEGEREITLITCTTGAVKRLIVKATEVYD